MHGDIYKENVPVLFRRSHANMAAYRMLLYEEINCLTVLRDLATLLSVPHSGNLEHR